jgi:protein ImuA
MRLTLGEACRTIEQIVNIEIVMVPAPADTLHQLRHAMAGIEGHHLRLPAQPSLRSGIAALDAALGGGLALGALHEIAPTLPLHAGAATGFALALAARKRAEGAQRHVLWIQTDFARAEGGTLYGPGIDLFGLSLQSFLMLAVPRSGDVLWAMEEALRSRAVAMVIGEVPDDRSADATTATRRLSLTARDGGGLCLLLRPHPSLDASAAATRWEISATSSSPDHFGGPGRTAFALSLTKNRRGPCGRWLLAWDHHDHVFFPALSLGVAAAARDRSDHAPLVRNG